MVTITGGIILKQKGSSITFKPKCEKCGNALSNESTVTLTRGVTEVSTVKCSYCNNNQIVKMKLLDD